MKLVLKDLLGVGQDAKLSFPRESLRDLYVIELCLSISPLPDSITVNSSISRSTNSLMYIVASILSKGICPNCKIVQW